MISLREYLQIGIDSCNLKTSRGRDQIEVVAPRERYMQNQIDSCPFIPKNTKTFKLRAFRVLSRSPEVIYRCQQSYY